MKRCAESLGPALVVVLTLGAACSEEKFVEPAWAGKYVTNSVVFGEDSSSSFVSLLPSLDIDEVDLDNAREFTEWADVWVHEGKVFVSDGSKPTVTRFAPDEDGHMVEDGRISFQRFGTESAAFWVNLFVKPNKAYLFNTPQREVVIWDPETLEVTGTFDMPELPDRGGQTLQVPSADRSAIVRGDRAYVPTLWADWEEYTFSEESVILVIDTDADEFLDTLEVQCPDINMATLDDDQNIYFSNWVFSIAPTLVDGAPKACAVRINDGTDEVDSDWSLTFADITEGREAAALEYIGDGKALMSVFHHERVEEELTPDIDRDALNTSGNWQFWTLDLETREARPLEDLAFNGGGLYGARVDGEFFLLVPDAEYASTKVYSLDEDGHASERWTITGWSNRLFELD